MEPLPHIPAVLDRFPSQSLRKLYADFALSCWVYGAVEAMGSSVSRFEPLPGLRLRTSM